MIKSMTGFGRSQQTVDRWEITVEVKSVNHRYFEFAARVPRFCGFLEEKLKKLAAESVARGKTEISVQLGAAKTADTVVSVNEELVKGYLGALRAVGEECALADDLTLSMVARLPDIFVVQKEQQDEQRLWTAVEEVARQALGQFVAMRAAEGEKLLADMTPRLDLLERTADEIDCYSEESVRAYHEKLEAKLQEVLQSVAIDQQRIVTEAAIFADKVAVDEETVRLRSHIAQFRQIIAADGPVGRKLDFLVQELNREVNTIGSKTGDLRVTNLVVSLKSEVEKIREQLQNVE